jgi:hypothetical protein
MAAVTPAIALTLAKNASYGGSVFRHGHLGVLVRLGDKLARMEALLSAGDSSACGETIADTIQDILGYAMLWQVLQQSQGATK